MAIFNASYLRVVADDLNAQAKRRASMHPFVRDAIEEAAALLHRRASECERPYQGKSYDADLNEIQGSATSEVASVLP